MTTAVLYSSVDQMLEPAELSRLLGRDVSTVETEPVAGLQGSTDADFLAVSVDGEATPGLLVKHVHPTTDWVALFTDDRRRRAVRLWSEGVLARMPSAVEPAVVACAEWADGYGILMPHLGSYVLESHVPQPAWMDGAILDAMAAMHAVFWEDPRLADPTLGLCSIDSQVKNISPRRTRQVFGEEPGGTRWVIEGWEEALPAIIDPGLARDLQSLIDDPRPIAEALAPYPKTLVHGDIRSANVGLSEDGGSTQCHFLDWGRSAFAAPSADLGFYLGFTAIEWQASVDERIATYESRLRAHLGARWPVDAWERQREVGLLAGLLQSSLGCRAYWGVRWATAEGHLDYVETERAAIQAWADRLRFTLGLL
jgi:hypothetical protein